MAAFDGARLWLWETETQRNTQTFEEASPIYRPRVMRTSTRAQAEMLSADPRGREGSRLGSLHTAGGEGKCCSSQSRGTESSVRRETSLSRNQFDKVTATTQPECQKDVSSHTRTPDTRSRTRLKYSMRTRLGGCLSAVSALSIAHLGEPTRLNILHEPLVAPWPAANLYIASLACYFLSTTFFCQGRFIDGASDTPRWLMGGIMSGLLCASVANSDTLTLCIRFLPIWITVVLLAGLLQTKHVSGRKESRALFYERDGIDSTAFLP